MKNQSPNTNQTETEPRRRHLGSDMKNKFQYDFVSYICGKFELKKHDTSSSSSSSIWPIIKYKSFCKYIMLIYAPFATFSSHSEICITTMMTSHFTSSPPLQPEWIWKKKKVILKILKTRKTEKLAKWYESFLPLAKKRKRDYKYIYRRKIFHNLYIIMPGSILSAFNHAKEKKEER